ncbi:hypothetical protein K458DRAFT_205004 [Lentithecium fluviatile CBS 122367]|uniref:Uncharacterized protein n=1 Tax=Lentithecium fluviatile CBS 122367 TaxID=1168545 RepID=A0A6G1J9S6_9PLEO|nr:hypothetical protein K458DRAFT_205004 [Lentithecium fluviatile CBS 122367]
MPTGHSNVATLSHQPNFNVLLTRVPTASKVLTPGGWCWFAGMKSHSKLAWEWDALPSRLPTEHFFREHRVFGRHPSSSHVPRTVALYLIVPMSSVCGEWWRQATCLRAADTHNNSAPSGHVVRLQPARMATPAYHWYIWLDRSRVALHSRLESRVAFLFDAQCLVLGVSIPCALLENSYSGSRDQRYPGDVARCLFASHLAKLGRPLSSVDDSVIRFPIDNSNHRQERGF